MSSIITREVGATAKGSPLTYAEVDNNFINLNTGKLETSNNLSEITDDATARSNIGAAKSGVNTDITSLTGITGGIGTADYLQFDTAATPTLAAGMVAWNDGDGTLDIRLKGNNVTLQTGQEQLARVFNDSGSTLVDGEIVYISGSQGNRIAVKRAQGSSEALSAHTLGMVTETIANGAEGYVTTSGLVRDLDTSALTAGATVYLSPTVLGGYTTTKPVAPNHTVVVGFVSRVHAVVGSIFIKVDNGYELDELHNVLNTSLTNGQSLVYESATGLWKNSFAPILTSATGLPLATGITGFGTGMATFLATPSSANLRSTITDETGSGSLVFGTSPTLSGVTLTGTTLISGTTNTFSDATDATSSTAAPVKMSGGVGIAKKLFVGTDLRVNGDTVIDGNLTVSGTTITLNTTNMAIEDNMIYLNNGSTTANPDLGIAANYNDGTYRHTGIFRDATDGVWKVFHQYTPEPDASAFIDTSHASFALANFQANTFIGALSGNATTATTLATARTITLNGDLSGSGSFNGSTDITITATIGANSVALGTDTTGDYVASMTAGTGITVGTATGEGSTPVITNTAPDQTVVLNGTGSVVVTGTYPNFTIEGTSSGAYLPIAGGTLTGTTDSTSKDTGTLIIEGGLGVEMSIFAGGQVIGYSDRRVKTNIKLIDNALAKVLRLNGYTFDRSDIETPRQTGVIAQEVLDVLPEAVVGSELGYGVAYGNLVGLLIEAIKEQNIQINDLKEFIYA